MEESMEEDRLGVQQDIQDIHRVLEESEEEEEEEEEDEEEDEGALEIIDVSVIETQPSSSQAGLQTAPGPSPPEASAPEASAENLLQLNLAYQEQIYTLLEHVAAARRKNREIQDSVTMNTDHSYTKGLRPITQVKRRYFSDNAHMAPPVNQEAEAIKAHKVPNPYTQPVKPWSSEEDQALYEGVRNDGLQRLMHPLMARQELLYAKLAEVPGGDVEESRALRAEINAVTEKLEEMNNSAKDEELLGDRMRPIDWMKISSLHLNGEKSASVCQLRWQNWLHPSINRESWTKEEQQRLEEVVQKFRNRDWEGVAQEIGNNRTPFQCLSEYQCQEISEYVKRPFTEEEDELIFELVDRFQIGNVIQFNKVAYFMDQRLTQQIANRWSSKLNPQAKSGFWTKEEDELLLKGMELYGFRWAKIAEIVKGRRATQIRDRWLYTLNPANKKGNYSLKEDLIILQSAKQYGVGSWVHITRTLSEQTMIGRTPNSVLHRFNSMLHSFFKHEKGTILKDGDTLEVLSEMPLENLLDEMIEYRMKKGEVKPTKNQLRFRELYTKKRRKDESPDTAKVLSHSQVCELDNQLQAAIKPAGWLLPGPSIRKRNAVNERKYKTRKNILAVLLKALAISTEGREMFLRDFLSDRRERQSQHDSKRFASVTDGKARMQMKKLQLNTGHKTYRFASDQDVDMIPDNFNSVNEGNHPSPQATNDTVAFSHRKQTSVVKNISGDKITKPSKKISIKVEPKSHSVFGEGTFQVPGKGYLVPVQNYVSRFGPNINQSQVVTVMRPPRAPAAPVSVSSGVSPLFRPMPGNLFQSRLLFPHTLQPVARLPTLTGGAPLQQPFGFPVNPQGHAYPPIQVPGGGYLLPAKPLQESSKNAAPSTASVAPSASLSSQPSQGTVPVSSAATSPHPSAELSSTSDDHVTRKQDGSSMSGNKASTSSSTKEVVHVTVVEDDDAMNVFVESGKKQTTLKKKEGLSCVTASAPDEEELSRHTKETTSTENAMREDIANSTDEEPICQPETHENVDETQDSSVQSRIRGHRNSSDTHETEQVLPILPPNEATISAFMKILLQRKQLEANSKKTKFIQSYHPKTISNGSHGGVRRAHSGPTNTKNVDVFTGFSGSESGGPTNRDSEGHESASSDNSDQSEDEEPADDTLLEGKTRKQENVVISERTPAQQADALEVIRESDWYLILKQRFLSMFLWPAVLSVVSPHEKGTVNPGKDQRKNETVEQQKQDRLSSGQHGPKPPHARKRRGRGKKSAALGKVTKQEERHRGTPRKMRKKCASPTGIGRRTRHAMKKASELETDIQVKSNADRDVPVRGNTSENFPDDDACVINSGGHHEIVPNPEAELQEELLPIIEGLRGQEVTDVPSESDHQDDRLSHFKESLGDGTLLGSTAPSQTDITVPNVDDQPTRLTRVPEDTESDEAAGQGSGSNSSLPGHQVDSERGLAADSVHSPPSPLDLAHHADSSPTELRPCIGSGSILAPQNADGGTSAMPDRTPESSILSPSRRKSAGGSLKVAFKKTKRSPRKRKRHPEVEKSGHSQKCRKQLEPAELDM